MVIRYFKRLIKGTNPCEGSKPSQGLKILLYLLLITHCSLLNALHAQIPSWTPPKGKFLGVSIKVGVPVKYALSPKYNMCITYWCPSIYL